MKIKPRVLVLRTDGTNCDEELAFAFQLAGGKSELVHVNDLRSKKESLNKFQILAVPGGFSYGDDIASGKVLATELTSYFSEDLQKFINRPNTLVIGICNGFQVLVRTGLLPFRRIGSMDATLTNNDSGHFECRWINLRIEKSNCFFLQDLEGSVVSYQVAHGEGKFFTTETILSKIEKNRQVAFRYVDENAKSTQEFPANPNGSMNAIAGITDTTGRILGMMPHPERFSLKEHHPNWRRMKNQKAQGLPIFKNMISFLNNA